MTNNFTPAKAGQQSKRLSKEEYAEKMKAEKEAVYQMADDTAKAIVSDPEKFKAFLDTQSRLDRYSAVNALLIFKQLPEASQLKNFDDWSKDNVKIQKGAKSISILEPVEYAKKDGTTGISYNVKKVFDVSQTNGKRPPAPTVNRDPKALITVMLDSSPVEVEATNELPYPNMAAFYNNEEQTLYVKRDVGDSVAVAQCVAQELGHAQLSINSDSYSRADMGFQAVCIGYMLCKKYGVDTQNFAINRIPEKLAGKEPKDIRYELSKTRNAMADIHSRVSDELYKKNRASSAKTARSSHGLSRSTTVTSCVICLLTLNLPIRSTQIRNLLPILSRSKRPMQTAMRPRPNQQMSTTVQTTNSPTTLSQASTSMRSPTRQGSQKLSL